MGFGVSEHRLDRSIDFALINFAHACGRIAIAQFGINGVIHVDGDAVVVVIARRPSDVIAVHELIQSTIVIDDEMRREAARAQDVKRIDGVRCDVVVNGDLVDVLPESVEFGACRAKELFCASIKLPAIAHAIVLHRRAQNRHLHEFIGRERVFGVIEARRRIVVEA